MNSTGMITPQSSRKEVASWAMYDWANSAFATTVIAGFFPIFYHDYWRNGVVPTQSTFELGMFNSIAGLIIALSAPLLGAIADRGAKRKIFLLSFAWIGAAMTAGLGLVPQESWQLAGSFFIVGVIGFLGANIFYDSMLVDMARGRSSDKVSALGYALGYLGGGLLFAINVAMTLKPQWFGLSGPGQAVKMSFIMVGLWWLIFSLPLTFFVKDGQGESMPIGAAISAGMKQLAQTFREIRLYRPVVVFLVAYWLYIDAVDTIISMATKVGKDLGFETSHLITALLLVQFIAFPAAIGFGFIGQKLGTRRGIYLALAVYVGVCVWAWRMDSVKEFFGLAIAIGLVQGGVQSLSRSYFSRLIPQDKAVEFFGFYNMLGKFAALLGPLLVGQVGLMTGRTQDGVLSLVLMLVLGWFILSRVQEA